MIITSAQINDAMNRDGAVIVRTRYGQPRQVVALYSDETVGTIRAEGNSAGTWRIQDIAAFVELHTHA